MLAIGDAAGLTKPMTGGGIFYSLLSAAFAVETLVDAFAADDLSASRLARYEKRWRQRLMPELYECYNPMPYEAALDMEIELAIHLRAKGYGVWQA